MTTMKKGAKTFLIVLVLLCIGGFAFKKLYWDKRTPTVPGQTTAASNTQSPVPTEKYTSAPTDAGENAPRTFKYQPEVPVNGKRKGIVEVGAEGFNSFVIEIDKQGRWKMLSKDFGKSLTYVGLASTEDIRSGLANYISDISNKGVDKSDIHFVVSSGAMKGEKTAAIIAELKRKNYVVNTVTAEQEGKLGLRVALPDTYKNEAFFVDMGSGNTKISWYENGTMVTKEELGAKYFDRHVADKDVYDAVKAAASSIPPEKRGLCFIIGGVPANLAKSLIQVKDERYTVLNNPDAYDAGIDKKLHSGLNIYQAIQDATKCQTFVFDWDANFSLGFLLNLPY